jgi:hypothetical protein
MQNMIDSEKNVSKKAQYAAKPSPNVHPRSRRRGPDASCRGRTRISSSFSFFIFKKKFSMQVLASLSEFSRVPGPCRPDSRTGVGVQENYFYYQNCGSNWK